MEHTLSSALSTTDQIQRPECSSHIIFIASCRDATKPVVQRGTQEPEYETSDDEDDSDFPPQKEHKMVLVVRTDLGMTKGKMAAQCCHAAVAAVRTAQATAPSILKHWELYGAAKVALKCSSEEEMLQLHKTALDAGVIAEYIEDAGRTQIPEGSRTVLAIGPAPIAQINQITGHLKLL
ncbi:peptidyl-tRNA hydrolase PTH2-domain-containing protein [Gaertneriomyces semiglobifer]|nr:peptidyl-tRNA hydrolase PTH2-domain-containing protein [Gaertneriomyces semiglobifer]